MATNRNREHRSTRSGAKYPIDCSRIQPMLFDYVSRELGDRKSMLVREHLRHCADCRKEAVDLQQTLVLMKHNDPGDSAPSALTGKRRKRLLWLMQHPFISRCLGHPRLTAFFVTVIVLTIIFIYLLTVRYPDFIRSDLPRYPVQLERAVSPVDAIVEDVDLPPPTIDPTPLPDWPPTP